MYLSLEDFLALHEFIGDINDSVYSHIDGDVPLPGVCLSPFELSTNGDYIYISIFDFPIWDSEEDPDQTLDDIKKVIVEEGGKVLEAIQMMKINIKLEKDDNKK